jgi:hypothetical protein
MVGGDGLTLRTVTGEPSDSNRISYLLPFLSVAVQAMLETFPAARFPSCVQLPTDASTSGTGRPSTFGRFLEFSSIWSTGNW